MLNAAALTGLALLLGQLPAGISWAGLFALSGLLGGWYAERGSAAWTAILRPLRPFALGLLVPVMKLWTWDGSDWRLRLDWLLLLVGLLLWGRLVRRCRALSGVLGFFAALSPAKRGLCVFLLSFLFFAAGVLSFEYQQVPLGGDEPHYLVIAQSVAEDGDFNVANQYYQQSYRKYLDVQELGIHGYFGKGGQQEIYSFHLPGVALSVTPLLWLLPDSLVVPAVRLLLAMYSALLMLVVYLCAWRLTGRFRPALLATLVMALTAPLYYYSFHFYPENQVMLLLLTSLYLRYLSPQRHRFWALALSGFSLGLLLFWGVKYASLLYLYGFGSVYGLLREKNWRGALVFIAGPLLMQGMFWAYLYSAYGNFSPASVYQNELQKSQFWGVITREQTLQMRLEAFLNYFLDQRDGLLLYAPIYALALAGFVRLCTLYRRYKRLFWLTVPALIYIGSYAMLTHRGGYCPQARPLTPVVWALALLVLFLFRHSKLRWLKRNLAGGLIAYGLFITVFQLVNPYTLYQSTTRDVQFRPGLLFQRLGNGLVDLSGHLPSFIKTDGNFAWWPNNLFIALLLMLTVWALWRKKPISAKFLRRVWILPWLLLFVLFPRLPLYNPVLVERSDILPHRLYGASLYPRQAENRYFRLGAVQHFPILLAPLSAPEKLEIRLGNPGDGTVQLRLWNFDRLLLSTELPGQSERIVAIPDYLQKKWQGQELIQLYVDNAGTRPDLEIEVLPRGRRPGLF